MVSRRGVVRKSVENEGGGPSVPWGITGGGKTTKRGSRHLWEYAGARITAQGPEAEEKPEKLKKKRIFVADSALVTLENLELLAQKQIRFISRLPQTFVVAEDVKEEAYKEGDWTEAGTLADKKGTAS